MTDDPRVPLPPARSPDPLAHPAWWAEVPTWLDLNRPSMIRTLFECGAVPRALALRAPLHLESLRGTSHPHTVTEPLLVAAGFRLFKVLVSGTSREEAWIRDDGFLAMGNPDDEDEIAWGTTDPARVPDLRALAVSLLALPQGHAEVGGLHALTLQEGRLHLRKIGRLPDHPFVRENYTTPVLQAFDAVVEDLQTSTPRGRLVVLDGPPGTGKSHWVRGLIRAVPTRFWVLLDPSAVASLTAPALLTELADHHVHGGLDLGLVVEDADAVLPPRGVDNLPAISALLNLCDGLLGEALDLRVVATTNAPKIQLDAALLRPGRLSAHVQVPLLTRAHALARCETLAGSMGSTPESLRWPAREGGVSLAEVYAEARRRGWKPPSRDVTIPTADPHFVTRPRPV